MTEIFVSFWGTEQTNASFYKVIKRSATMVTVRQIGKVGVPVPDFGPFTYRVTPDAGDLFGEPIRRKVRHEISSDGEVVEIIKIDDERTAFTWDETPLYIERRFC